MSAMPRSKSISYPPRQQGAPLRPGTPSFATAGRRRQRRLERVVRTAEDSLRFCQRVNLIGSGLLAHVEILDQPVAFAMKVSDVLLGAHECPQVGLFLATILLEGTLRVSLATLLVSQRLGIQATLVC